jgi:glycogen phosphorylase
MLNGAVTIGTWDGANIEIAEAVGPENIFIFGLKSNEVEELKRKGYNPKKYIKNNPSLKKIMRLIKEDFFSKGEAGIFRPLYDSLVHGDNFMVLADFEEYVKKQEEVSNSYADQENWTKKSIINTARSGRFSSDRTVKEYADEIWKVGYNNRTS